ncbi:MAG: DNA translocase FtsK, partial [Thermoanaerobacteraceae bacterium]|nr:DNA translocase FtsK [Thermoanaerobacteraceae bacterium]
MPAPRKKQSQSKPVTEKSFSEMTWGERIFQANLVLALVGAGCAFYVYQPELRQWVLNLIPLPLAYKGMEFGLGIPAVCLGIYLLRQKPVLDKLGRFASWLDNIGADKQAEAKPAGKKVEDLLPDAPREAYERSGQGIARRVAPALEHIGLTQPGERVDVIDVSDGPAAARVIISLPPGLRLTRVQNSAKDLQAAIGAPSLQVVSGPRANTAALIVTHRRKQPVVLKQVVTSDEYQELLKKGGLPVPVGVNEVGEPVLTDLTRVAHLLVAGATGAGKSWWLNEVLVSWLMYLGPDRLRIALVDPKQVELSDYRDFPHVLKVATTPDDAVALLKTLCAEMDARYAMFRDAGVKNIAGYRRKTKDNMPYIACVIDELADLMIQAKDDVEENLQRLTQLARAAGIHLIVATQRPSVNVITGVIKANLPSRIVFRLVSQHDYMTVLDSDPGVTLTGKGDGLALLEGEFGLIRFQSPGVGVSDEQTEQVLARLKDYWRRRGVEPAPVPAFDGAGKNGGAKGRAGGETVELAPLGSGDDDDEASQPPVYLETGEVGGPRKQESEEVVNLPRDKPGGFVPEVSHV